MEIILEVKCEPIQKLRMARTLAGTAEVFQRLDDSSAEQLFPITVHNDSPSKWLSRRKEPLRQSEPVARHVGRKFWKDCWDIRQQVRAYLVQEVPALKLESSSPFIRFLLRHNRDIRGRNLRKVFA